MKFWRFMDYHDPNGVNLIGEWYKAQDPSVQARFDFVLRILEVTETVEEWIKKGMFKVLQKPKHAGLCEIRFSIEIRATGRARKFRPLGFWRPNHNEFILASGVEKVGKDYIPS